jgi:hypothetical protein
MANLLFDFGAAHTGSDDDGQQGERAIQVLDRQSDVKL